MAIERLREPGDEGRGAAYDEDLHDGLPVCCAFGYSHDARNLEQLGRVALDGCGDGHGCPRVSRATSRRPVAREGGCKQARRDGREPMSDATRAASLLLDGQCRSELLT
jgi:hypothetical protein